MITDKQQTMNKQQTFRHIELLSAANNAILLTIIGEVVRKCECSRVVTETKDEGSVDPDTVFHLYSFQGIN